MSLLNPIVFLSTKIMNTSIKPKCSLVLLYRLFPSTNFRQPLIGVKTAYFSLFSKTLHMWNHTLSTFIWPRFSHIYPCLIIFLFIHAVACNSSSFFSVAAWYCIVWIYQHLCNHSPMDGQLGYFQFLSITNKTAMEISVGCYFCYIYQSGGGERVSGRVDVGLLLKATFKLFPKAFSIPSRMCVLKLFQLFQYLTMFNFRYYIRYAMISLF